MKFVNRKKLDIVLYGGEVYGDTKEGTNYSCKSSVNVRTLQKRQRVLLLQNKTSDLVKQ